MGNALLKIVGKLECLKRKGEGKIPTSRKMYLVERVYPNMLWLRGSNHVSWLDSPSCMKWVCILLAGKVESRRKNSVKANVGGGGSAPGSFLTMEEAGLVDMSSLDMHEKFLCRLTVRSWPLIPHFVVQSLTSTLVCSCWLNDLLIVLMLPIHVRVLESRWVSNEIVQKAALGEIQQVFY